MNEMEKLQRSLAQGRISRREFLSRSAALSVAGAVPAAFVGSTASAAVAHKRGGVLRLGMGGGHTNDTLDPGTIEDSMSSQVNYQIRNNLTEVAPDGTLRGELAESWEADATATEWTFKLRDGVEFHNGKTLEAEDVISSITHHTHDDSNSAIKGILEQIVEMKADGKGVVVMKLKSGNADFPFIMSDYHGTIFPKDSDVLEGVGTGPFVLESFEPGVRSVAKRNENYFKEGLPYFDAVEITSIADAAARDNALKTGQVDATNRVDQKTANLLDKLPGVRLLKTTGTKHYAIPMLADIAPFDNVDVRRALKYAFDREALLKTVLGGHGQVGNDVPIAPHQPYYNPNLEQHSFDPDKTKFHLKQAGMENLKIDLSTANAAFDGAVDAAVLIKEHAAQAGIDINVVREADDGYWTKVWQHKPWSMCYWGGRPTQDWMWSTSYETGAAWNDNHWEHSRFQELLLSARAELDEAKRTEMYHEMQQLHWDEGAVVVALFASDLMGVSEKLMIPEQVAANWELDGEKCAERWSFA